MTFKIVLLDYHETPTSRSQAAQVLDSLKARVRPEYIGIPLAIEVRRVEASGETDPVALADKAGLSAGQWRTLPIIPRLPIDQNVALPLWREIAARRGYAYPIVRGKPRDEREAQVWDLAQTMEDVAGALWATR